MILSFFFFCWANNECFAARLELFSNVTLLIFILHGMDEPLRS